MTNQDERLKQHAGDAPEPALELLNDILAMSDGSDNPHPRDERLHFNRDLTGPGDGLDVLAGWVVRALHH